MVDLLDQHHREGRRFEPTEFIEEGQRIAVRLTVSEPGSAAATGVFKVFTFGPGEEAVLLQDCTGRDDALTYLEAE